MAKHRILIVDDDIDLSRAMKISIEQTGPYSVRLENNPRMAIRAVREFEPELIIMDVIMPGMDGGMVAAAIRQDDRLKSIPIVFLTSIVDKGETGAKGGVIGGEEVIAKPVTSEEIIARIEKILGAGRKE